ncbi:MAG: UDP-N-acetylmuramoyl-L-alanyl-D-glutamate--2,6-diaminopimelate ligase [Acidimicrobiaceae bacterium]|nr:UDP-N-acetylmuramoyl-L-alanyl-D-glutamate--2,6-diaminopimelate ligase [Acidimicrobiaceae bacterium]
MHLGDLFPLASFDLETATTEVLSVEIDSRQCTFGSLFVAHGHDDVLVRTHVTDALARGAVAVVSTRPLGLPVPEVIVEASELGRVSAQLAADLSGHPERDLTLVGVTGTNGKTTVASLISHLLANAGRSSGVIGTLTQVRTTPAAPELYRHLSQWRAYFGPAALEPTVVLEVSSHALVQDRVAGLTFELAVFTNLSHDHLDYHGSMEEYFAAKARLFTPEYSRRALVWVDNPYGERLSQSAGVEVVRVSRDDASDVVGTLLGTTFIWRARVVSSALVGGYNVDNLLVAMAAASELGLSDPEIVAGVGSFTPVEGRFSIVRAGGIDAVVDYAHTPDGLERLLSDVRSLSTGRVITVFGCGGDRDRAKRPRMGEVASRASDLTIVTSDNPRHESPDAIMNEIVSGVVAGSRVERVADRAEAIARAVAVAEPGDVVVVAGKGHERTQVFADREVPFNDHDVVAEELRKR